MPARPLVLVALVTLVVAWSTSATAQDKAKLSTDRPDFTEAAFAVPAGEFQLESGLSFSHDHQVASYGGVSVLGRYGLASFAEARLSLPRIAISPFSEETTGAEVGPVAGGAKFAGKVSKSISIGLLPSAQVPTDGNWENWTATTLALVGVSITPDVSIGANAGILVVPAVDEEREIQGAASTSLQVAWTDRLNTFVESFAMFRDGDTNVYADTGVTYILAQNLQLDAFIGAGLPDVEAIFGGAGVSVRF